MTVAIQPRRTVLAVVAGAATGLAIAYAVAAGRGHTELAGWVSLVLAVIAVVHLRAFVDARRPLLVADDDGVRVRAGSTSWQLEWAQIDRVDLRAPRRWHDGLVVVHPRESARPRPAAPRARRALRRNARRYDHPLAAPFGLLTRTARGDLRAQLEALAGDRFHLLGSQPTAAPTVEVTAVSTAEPADAIAPVPTNTPVRPAIVRPAIVRALASTGSAVSTARRGEFTVGPAATVHGALALDRGADAPSALDLPERADLRRPTDDPVVVETSARSARREAQGPAVDGRGDEQGAIVAADSMGGQLAHARVVLGVTVDSLAERTHIRPHVIECLERNDVSACGGDVYARGHLRVLSGALGLDAKALVADYDAHYAGEPIPVRAVFEAELASGRGGDRRHMNSGPRWVWFVAVVVAVAAAWGVAQVLSRQPAAPAHVARHAAAAPQVSRPLPGPARVSAVLRATDGNSHVYVTDRYGHRLYTGILTVGRHVVVRGVAPLRVHADNGSVVAMRVDGTGRGLLAKIQQDQYGHRLLVPTTILVKR